MSAFRKGLALFAYDIRNSLPLSVTFAVVCLAFVFALLVATGLHT